MQLVLWTLQVIGSATLATGLLAVLAFLGKRTLGAWIDSRFDKALERFRTAQAKELQHLEHKHEKELEGIRFELSKLSHRIQGIHEKEIEVLSEAWRKLKAAEGAVFLLVTPFDKHSDFDAMPEKLLSEAVGKLPLAEFYKEQLIQAPKKNELYRKLMGFKKHNDAENSTRDLNNYVIENAPFLGEELRARLEAVFKALMDTVIRDEINRQARELWASYDREFIEWEGVAPLVREIEQLIRKRLRYDEA